MSFVDEFSTDAYTLNNNIVDLQSDKQDLKMAIDERLVKLHGLSADDKTENALLRSRIDEQSQLIMILKQRCDESHLSAKTLERINLELEESQEIAREERKNQTKKYKILNSRFDDLAKNHQEMIRFKDEYKKENQALRRENSRLQDENEQLFSKAVQEKSTKIVQLEEQLNVANINCSRMRVDGSKLEAKLQENAEDMRAKEQFYANEKELFGKTLELLREKLRDAEMKLEGEILTRQNSSVDSDTRIQQLTKEKDELLQLTMQRGKLVQEKQIEIRNLLTKIVEMERNSKLILERVQKEKDSLNADLCLSNLRAQLTQAEEQRSELAKTFEAFKLHSSKMLEKERELNYQLRHLAN